MDLATVLAATVDDRECLASGNWVKPISLSSASRRATAGVQNAAIAGG